MSTENPLLVGDLTNSKRQHSIVLASGGMDAFYAMMSFYNKYDEATKFTLLHFDYGQKALEAERLCVQRQATYLNRLVAGPVVDVVYMRDSLSEFLTGHPLMSDEVQRRAHSGYDVTNEQLYIPNRNARFMIQAFGLAELIGATNIIFGAIGNNFNLDNSLPFSLRMLSLNEVSGEISNKAEIGIYAPFTLFSKSIAPHYARTIGLWDKAAQDMTVSCYFPYVDENSKIYHCGVCTSCKVMQHGIKFACVADPYNYIDDTVRAKILPQAIPPHSKTERDSDESSVTITTNM